MTGRMDMSGGKDGANELERAGAPGTLDRRRITNASDSKSVKCTLGHWVSAVLASFGSGSSQNSEDSSTGVVANEVDDDVQEDVEVLLHFPNKLAALPYEMIVKKHQHVQANSDIAQTPDPIDDEFESDHTFDTNPLLSSAHEFQISAADEDGFPDISDAYLLLTTRNSTKETDWFLMSFHQAKKRYPEPVCCYLLKRLAKTEKCLQMTLTKSSGSRRGQTGYHCTPTNTELQDRIVCGQTDSETVENVESLDAIQPTSKRREWSGPNETPQIKDEPSTSAVRLCLAPVKKVAGEELPSDDNLENVIPKLNSERPEVPQDTLEGAALGKKSRSSELMQELADSCDRPLKKRVVLN